MEAGGQEKPTFNPNNFQCIAELSRLFQTTDVVQSLSVRFYVVVAGALLFGLRSLAGRRSVAAPSRAAGIGQNPLNLSAL